MHDDDCYICNDDEYARMGLPLCFPCPVCGEHIAADDDVCANGHNAREHAMTTTTTTTTKRTDPRDMTRVDLMAELERRIGLRSGDLDAALDVLRHPRDPWAAEQAARQAILDDVTDLEAWGMWCEAMAHDDNRVRDEGEMADGDWTAQDDHETTMGAR